MGKKCHDPGSNRGHLDLQSNALPTELSRLHDTVYVPTAQNHGRVKLEICPQDQLEFPCTGDAVGGHFNPYNWDASESPKPSLGTPDQYEIGDLSGKYGLLKQQSNMRGVFNDSNLPLFGAQSVVGRSVVVHKKYKVKLSALIITIADIVIFGYLVTLIDIPHHIQGDTSGW